MHVAKAFGLQQGWGRGGEGAGRGDGAMIKTCVLISDFQMLADMGFTPYSLFAFVHRVSYNCCCVMIPLYNYTVKPVR